MSSTFTTDEAIVMIAKLCDMAIAGIDVNEAYLERTNALEGDLSEARKESSRHIATISSLQSELMKITASRNAELMKITASRNESEKRYNEVCAENVKICLKCIELIKEKQKLTKERDNIQLAYNKIDWENK
jgi:hypothetical protein